MNKSNKIILNLKIEIIFVKLLPELEEREIPCPIFKIEFMSAVGHFVMVEDPSTCNNLLEKIIKEFITK